MCTCIQWCSGCRADANEAAVILLPSNITVFTLDFSGSGLSDGDYVSLGWHEVSYLFMNVFICSINYTDIIVFTLCHIILGWFEVTCFFMNVFFSVNNFCILLLHTSVDCNALSSWMLLLQFRAQEIFRLFLTIPLCGRKMIWRLWCHIWGATNKYPV